MKYYEIAILRTYANSLHKKNNSDCDFQHGGVKKRKKIKK